LETRILHSNPVYETISVDYEFPQNGGPNLIFNVRKSSSDMSPIPQDSLFTFQVLGSGYDGDDPKKRLWNVSTNIFGSLSVSVVRSFLPVRLVDAKTAGI